MDWYIVDEVLHRRDPGAVQRRRGPEVLRTKRRFHVQIPTGRRVVSFYFEKKNPHFLKFP